MQYKLASEFQEVVAEILLSKCDKAIKLKKKLSIHSFVLAGGVASNKFIREKLKKLCNKHSMEFVVPEKKLCIDNAIMIAWAGIERLRNNKKTDSFNKHPQPRWSLENL